MTDIGYLQSGGGASCLAAELNFDTVRIENDGTRISVATGGNEGGAPLLLIHGFPGNAYSWVEVARMLASRYRLIVPDMRGYGDSDVPHSGYDGRTLANDFARIMEALKHERFHVMAHGMGASAALLLAADRPERVRTLTYLEQPVLLPDIVADTIRMKQDVTMKGGLWWWMAAQSPSMMETLVHENERDFIAWFYDNLSVEKEALSQRVLDVFAADLAGERKIHGWFGMYREIFTTIDQIDGLEQAKVTRPVLSIGGEMSLGLDMGSDLKLVAQDVTIRELPDTGCFPMIEQPKELADMFEEFVAAHPG